MLKTKNILYPLTVATILALSGCGSSSGATDTQTRVNGAGGTQTTGSYIGQPPVAYAGEDITVGTGQAVTLDGSGSSDPDGNLVSYEWRASSGEGIKSANPTLELGSLPVGVYTATLIVTDDQLNTATDSMTITVTEVTTPPAVTPPPAVKPPVAVTPPPAVKPPVAGSTPVSKAGADQTITEGDDLNLDGSASTDSDGTIVKYEWYDITNPTATTLGATVTITGLAVGTYTIELKVTDNDGATATDRMVVTVVAAPEPKSTLKKTGQTTSYDTNGKDDGAYQTGVPHSYTRDNSNDTVTDNITGLMWQDDADAKTIHKDWEDTGTYCATLGLGGFSDWRLPTIDELVYITDKDKVDPAIDTAFANVVSSYYWSSTTYASNGSNVWIVYFEYGDDYYDVKSNSYYVRCVRVVQ